MKHNHNQPEEKTKVLIVDDNEQNLYMLEVLLKSEHYEVTRAGDGREALEHLKRDSCQLIISDILMPRMDGFQLCRECKADQQLKHIPFIFYTATYTDKKDEDFALSLGADRFILKPAEPAEFMNTVRAVTSEYRNNFISNREPQIENEETYLTEYNERLIRKLEAKMIELEKTNKALKESEDKYRLLVETSGEAIIIVQDGFFKFVNPATEKLTGYTAEELLKIPFLDLVHPDSREELSAKYSKWLAGKALQRKYEFQGIDKQGRKLWVESVSTLVAWERKPAIMSFIRDVTEQRRLESQLVQAQKMEALGTLAGGIAHDFNNLLTVIMGYGEFLMMRMEEGNPSRKFMEQLLAASNKAVQLTQSLLAFSRQQPVILKPLELNNAVRGTDKLLKRLLTEDIELKIKLADEDIVIMADNSQIDQILFNLATNARDAMPKGGVLYIGTECVELDSEFVKLHGLGKPGAYAVVSVSDTGHGMDEKTREQIFDPFFTTKEVGRGTGLGLATVYGIVKKHNGYINIYSEVGQGTTFRIYFPSIGAKADMANNEEPARTGGTETILIAEDDAAVRNFMKTVCNDFGYSVIEAVDGENAVELFRRNRERVDLLIIDSVMPKMNGREAYEAIRKIDAATAVIFTSGHTRDIILMRGIEEKEFEFISKPLSSQTLLRKIRSVLDARSVGKKKPSRN